MVHIIKKIEEEKTIGSMKVFPGYYEVLECGVTGYSNGWTRDDKDFLKLIFCYFYDDLFHRWLGSWHPLFKEDIGKLKT